MAFANIWQWLKTAASNTSLNGIALGENVMLPSGVNNAFRELMSQIATVESKGTAVASAGTLVLGTERYYHITGTTPITDIDFTDAVDGRWAWLIFDDALTLTYNATTLQLPGGQSILTEAGDRGLFVQDSSDNIICLTYQQAGAPTLSLPADVIIPAVLTVPNTGLHILDNNASHDVVVSIASNITADRNLTIQVSDANTNLNLVDPGADRLMFWDDSAAEWTALALTSNLVIDGTTLRAYEVWGGAISDETTAITTGTGKLSFSIPYAFTVVGVYATLNTVSSSGTPTFDIKEAGTTILSTKIVIDVSEFTGGSAGYQGTAAGAAVISDTSIAAFAQITVDIDVAGTGAKGAKVFIVGYPT